MKLVIIIFSFSVIFLTLPSCSTSKIATNNSTENSNNKLANTNRQTIDDFDLFETNTLDKTAGQSILIKDIEVPLVKPALDKLGINKILQDYAFEFDACYQDGLQKSSTPEEFNGHLLLKFKINPAGKVENADITSVDFHSDEVKNCIKNKLNEIPFPESSKTVAINQPINLIPVNK